MRCRGGAPWSRRPGSMSPPRSCASSPAAVGGGEGAMRSAGFCAQVACVWEATARKPGNVHRFCDFDDTTYLDFLLSAAAVAPALDAAVGRRVGETVLDAVQATRAVVPSNTNL